MADSSETHSLSKEGASEYAPQADMTAGQSSTTGASKNLHSAPISPPDYGTQDGYEMQSLPRLVNQSPAALPVPPPQVQAYEEPFNFNFYRPKKDIRTYLLSLVFLLALALVAVATVFGVKFANLKQQMKDQPKAQNTTLTVYSTDSTSFLSTYTSTASTTLSTTASTTLSKTLLTTLVESFTLPPVTTVSTQTDSTTLLSTVSTTESTTYSTTDSITLSMTLTQSVTLPPVTAVSTLVQQTTIVQISTLQTTLPTATTQLSTVTATSTLSTIQPSAVSACWVLLDDICNNSTQVPPDLTNDGFGNCSTIYRFFYCGLINHLEAIGDLILPADSSPICGGMKEFCNSNEANSTEALVEPPAPPEIRIILASTGIEQVSGGTNTTTLAKLAEHTSI
ncbi:uncharacterized protein LY89DRAFT_764097 [Mollisia scopiformis]|uniref:Uncharacterized protein n=1 Tax=Mollisia scopiformis TaxID=149040 RepID=A0A132B8N1_MOLSC|nr:uncharacterized protein LY89DRAFT_764097 [Mollisia scopiformis]KUJ08762.1 hypothetical protein LY89DRAFT_764097 [Mollisia scopiformis]